jgi:hypothetical protein
VSIHNQRQNLWQSLYVMDCFLASSLGRPNTISCASVSELVTPTAIHRSITSNPPEANGFLASVKASKLTGEVLNRIYHKRKASLSIASILSLRFNDWMKELPAELHWRQISCQDSDPDMTLKLLHINLIYFHGVMLLTRPFLLYEISKQLRDPKAETTCCASELSGVNSHRDSVNAETSLCFHGACVHSSVYTIKAIHTALGQSALPRSDPFVMYAPFRFLTPKGVI